MRPNATKKFEKMRYKMTISKRELEDALLTLSMNFEMTVKSYKILLEAMERIFEENLNQTNDRITKISDIAFIALVASGLEVGKKETDKVLKEYELAKKRLNKDQYSS